MKQVIRKGLKEIIVDEVADPTLIPHHVLVRPFYSLISAGTETASIHTDSLVREVAENPSHLAKVWEVAKQAGPLSTLAEVRAKFSEYAVIGYAGAGVVVDKHESVTDVEIGDRVSYGGEGTGHAETILAARNLVAKIPEGVTYADASFTTLGSIAMNAVRVSEIGMGDVVAVVGLGLVGQLVAQLARVQGGVVIAMDIKPERIALARDLGAEHGVHSNDIALQKVLELTQGRGADRVIVAAASRSPAPVQLAVQISRDRGCVTIVGAMPLELPRDAMYIKELQVRMARAYGPGSYDPEYEHKGRDYPLAYVRWTENRNMAEFLRQVAAGRVNPRPLVSHEFPLAEAEHGYQTIMDPQVNSLAVLLRYPRQSEQEEVAGFAPARRVESGASAPVPATGLRVALVGAGNLAKWAHLPNLRKIPGVSLRAVFSASGARGKSYALRFGAQYSSTDYDEILRDKDVDVVIIATRHQHHFTQAYKALKAGKHVFLEKPFAISKEECRDLYRAAGESGRQITVGFNRRFSPYYLDMKKRLAGRAGPVVINCRMNSPGLTGNFWAADPAIGGAIVGEGCHFVDLMFWLLGAEPVKVSAWSLPRGKSNPIGENNISAAFQFADGSIGNLTYCTVGSRTSGGERVEVFAPGMGLMTENMKRYSVKGSTASSSSRWFAEKGYLAQMQAFMQGIQSGRPPEVTARDGVRATVGALLMLESAARGEPCEFLLDEFLKEVG